MSETSAMPIRRSGQVCIGAEIEVQLLAGHSKSDRYCSVYLNKLGMNDMVYELCSVI